MYQTITESDFIRAFVEYGREDNFSISARRKLFAYLESLEEDTDQPIELDVIALCCEWSECDLEELQEQYNHLLDAWPDVYRYVVDLDERGEYRATVYKITQDGTETVAASVDGAMFADGGELEGVSMDDPHAICEELPGLPVPDYVLSASDDVADVVDGWPHDLDDWSELLSEHTIVIETDNDTLLFIQF